MAAKKKKRATKKKTGATKRRKPANPLTCKLEVRKVMVVEQGNVYLVKCGGEGKSTIELGHVIASSETAARTKARQLLKRLL